MKCLKHNIVLGISLLIMAISNNVAHAVPAPTEDPFFYYQIGGAAPVTVAPNSAMTTTSISIGGGVELGLNYSCLKFDPVLAITNLFNNFNALADQFVNQMVTAAGAAIASLPALILQRASPGLYDLFQNQLLRFEELVSISTKSCQRMEQEIRQGINPYEDFLTISVGSRWKQEMGFGGVGSATNDVITAEQNVASDDGCAGAPWALGTMIGGQRYAGGCGQPPIQPAGDTIFVGYNLQTGQPPEQTGPPTLPPGPLPKAVEIWATPEEARNWLQSVVGDLEITTYGGGPRGAKAGYGLVLEMEQTSDTIEADIMDLVNGTVDPTRPSLDNVSGPQTGITRAIIDTTKLLSPTEQTIVVARLADEVAIERVLDKAIIARRLLITGMKEPNILSNGGAALEVIEEAVDKIEKEIETLMFETNTKQQLVNNTARLLLQYDAYKRKKALSSPGTKPVDANPVMEGGGIQD